jgi:uncharacterized membrane protein
MSVEGFNTRRNPMFGLKRKGVVDAAGVAGEQGGRLLRDEKARQRAAAAVAAGLAALQLAQRQTGLTGSARRLASDPELRAQLAEMVEHIKKAQSRLSRKRGHKLRNSMLVLAGFGVASAAAAVPAVRESVRKLLQRGRRTAGAVGGGTSPTAVVEEIEVYVPVSRAYNQWTQFEEFPQFMEGVDEVRQLDDTLLHWAATVAGKHAEWNAKIVEQEPDRRISWESTDGKHTRGTVTFEEAGPERTKIHLTMSYLAEGPLERGGSAVGLDARRIRGDLERFKDLVESRGAESGAWRGEIHEGSKTS